MNCIICDKPMGWVYGKVVCTNPYCSVNTPTTTSDTTAPDSWPEQTTGSIAARENREAMQPKNTDTPRTDAAQKLGLDADGLGYYYTDSDFSRLIERELNEARALVFAPEGTLLQLVTQERDTLERQRNKGLETISGLAKELDAWRKVADGLAYQLNVPYHTLFPDSREALAAYEKLKKDQSG